MKTNFVFGLVGALLVLVLMGCNLFGVEEEKREELRILPPSGGTAAIPDNFWGEWIDLKTGESRYIDDSNDDNLTRLSDNVITDESGALLIPNRIANASFSGKVASLGNQSRSARAVGGGLGRRQGRVTNLKNATDTHTFTAGENGEYAVPGVIPGDTYEVEVEDEKISFTPAGDGDNAGTITLIDDGGTNFKVSFKQYSDNIVYAHPSSNGPNATDQYINGRIIIENTGDIDATAVTYQLTPENGLYVSNLPRTGILGTIEPGRTEEIGIAVACYVGVINGDFAFKTINVQLTDPINNRTWHDSFSLKFYKKEVEFHLRPRGNISCILVSPSGIYKLGNNYWESFPLISGNYTLVLSGAATDSETVYAFLIDSPKFDSSNFDSLNLFAGFTDTARYEPNNTEQTAAIITSDEIVAYLHKGDFDYYKFRLAYY
jgi:hypothetical protein